MATSRRLEGVFCPVVTPFGAGFLPDRGRFIRHCQWLLDQEVGLAIFGTNSEGNSLTVKEKRTLLDALLEAGQPPTRMMPGTGACALPDTIELTKHATTAGCAGVLMLPPFYYKGVSDEGLFRAYASVIEGVADERVRIYLYHIPAVSGVPISLALIERLLDSFPDAIAGIKDSSGDSGNITAMIERFGGRGFEVFAGTEVLLLSTMRAGGAGCITATSNVNPSAIVRLYKSWRQDDADLQQEKLTVQRALFARFPLISAMKSAIAVKSGNEEWQRVRPPLLELDAGQAANLIATLDEAGFDIPNAESLA